MDIEYAYSGNPLNGRSQFGYQAVEDTTKTRKAPPITTRHEDVVLEKTKRRKLQASTRDVIRNFNVVGWMCRKHLDYVTSFSFKAKTGNAEFDRQLEAYIDNQSTKDRFHVARRHPRRRFLRIAEGRRVLDGDFGVLRFLGTPGSLVRGKLQGIESDLIKDPAKTDVQSTRQWINGVEITTSGAATRYCLHRRKPKSASTEEARKVQAKDLFLHGYFDSTFRHDQVRGISPFASALNTLRDTSEIIDYAKAKHKVAQLFGLVIKREDQGPLSTDETDDADGIPESINFTDGPQVLELNTEESAEFLENKTAANETVDLLRFLMQLAVLSLDFPISMLDERETTFFGGRGALMQYLKSAKAKIEDNRDLLNWWTKWRIGIAVFDGDVQLPPGVEFESIMWEWCPAGIPWWDASKEVNGYGAAVAAGFTTFDDVIKEVHGGRHNAEENIRENARVFAIARELNFPLTLPGVGTITPTTGELNEPDLVPSGDQPNQGDEPDDEGDIEDGR